MTTTNPSPIMGLHERTGVAMSEAPESDRMAWAQPGVECAKHNRNGVRRVKVERLTASRIVLSDGTWARRRDGSFANDSSGWDFTRLLPIDSPLVVEAERDQRLQSLRYAVVSAAETMRKEQTEQSARDVARAAERYADAIVAASVTA